MLFRVLCYGDLFGFADLWLNSVDLCSLFDVGIADQPVWLVVCSLLFGWVCLVLGLIMVFGYLLLLFFLLVRLL